MKAKIIFTFLLLISLYQITSGQITDAEALIRSQNTDSVDGWKKGGVIALNLAQTSFTNWSAGGQNSFSVDGLLNVYLKYKRDNTTLDNTLDVGYGLLKQGKKSDFIKTDDKFDFLSKFGKEAFKEFYYAALINFKTQMTVGKNYAKDSAKISNYLSPAYLIEAVGLDYKPNSNFSAFVAPLTGKFTFVNDQELANAGSYGVKPATYDTSGNVLVKGEKTKSEFGGYIRILYSRKDFKKEILKNVSFTSKIDLFSNYSHKPENIDINWETQLALKVNKYISVNISTQLLYDDDIVINIDTDNNGTIDQSGARVQFKDVLGAGVSVKF